MASTCRIDLLFVIYCGITVTKENNSSAWNPLVSDSFFFPLPPPLHSLSSRDDGDSASTGVTKAVLGERKAGGSGYLVDEKSGDHA